jgi:hypothetical protein
MSTVLAVYRFHDSVRFCKFVEFASAAEALAYTSALSDNAKFAVISATDPFLSAFDIDVELDKIRDFDQNITSRCKKAGIKLRVKN